MKSTDNNCQLWAKNVYTVWLEEVSASPDSLSHKGE